METRKHFRPKDTWRAIVVSLFVLMTLTIYTVFGLIITISNLVWGPIKSVPTFLIILLVSSGISATILLVFLFDDIFYPVGKNDDAKH